MTNQTPPITRFFLAKLSLPVHLVMVRTAVDCATQIGRLLSFDDTDRYHLEVAVEEAFANAVEHFSGPAQDDERIRLEFFVEEDLLIVSIREKGIPFDLQQAKRYTPDTLEGMDAPGLGMLLMHQGMDSVELFVHGREGKETRLTKKIKYGALPQELLDTKIVKHGRKRPTVKNAIVREPTLDELAEVCRLAWRCYGFTQEDFLYDLELLTKKYKSGELRSVVAFDPASGNMIGHAGLKYHDPKVKVPELALAFLDPAYRCSGLSAKMSAIIFELSKDHGDAGVFDCAVTTHTFSQKAMQEYFGSRPCSLLMGIAASGMQVKELATSRQEKGSVISHYFAFDRSEGTAYISPHHQEMVAEIYKWMEVPREFGTPNMQPPSGDSSVSVFPLPDELNVAFIIVHAIGENTVKEVEDGMHQCKRDRRDAVYAFLPLGVASSPYLVEKCEKMGFSFAGIMPHIHDGDDRILMQRVDIPLDMEAIRVYGDMSRKLFEYIKDEQQRVEDM